MSCECKPCKECGGTGDVYYSFNGEYLGNHRLDDLDELDFGGCPACEGYGLEYLCDECREAMESEDD